MAAVDRARIARETYGAYESGDRAMLDPITTDCGKTQAEAAIRAL
jgi:hypothetical protein